MSQTLKKFAKKLFYVIPCGTKKFFGKYTIFTEIILFSAYIPNIDEIKNLLNILSYELTSGLGQGL